MINLIEVSRMKEVRKMQKERMGDYEKSKKYTTCTNPMHDV